MTPEFLQNVIIFGAPYCNKCADLKAKLEQFGDNFTYIDTTTPAGENLALKENIRGLPSVFINGTLIPGTWKHLEHQWKVFQQRNELQENPFNGVAAQGIYAPPPIDLNAIMADARLPLEEQNPALAAQRAMLMADQPAAPQRQGHLFQ